MTNTGMRLQQERVEREHRQRRLIAGRDSRGLAVTDHNNDRLGTLYPQLGYVRFIATPPQDDDRHTKCGSRKTRARF